MSFLRHFRNGKTWAAVAWLIFTFALVIWWWIFADRLLAQSSISDTRILHGYRMLLYEGGTLLGLLVVGGLALVFYVYRDVSRTDRLRLFFASFSHDIKTAIARLRLQSDVLMEEKNFQDHPVLQRLIQDIDRLELQLENSLLFSGPQPASLLIEKIRLSEIISWVRAEFPALEILLSSDAEILADRRAFLSIVRNFFHNSFHHGGAKKISVVAQSVKKDTHVTLNFNDDGSGCQKDPQTLGLAPFSLRADPKKEGAGIGLYLCRTLIQRMNGEIKFQNLSPGFSVLVTLPKPNSTGASA